MNPRSPPTQTALLLMRVKNFLLRDHDNVDDESATLKAELKQLGFEGTISKDGLEQIYSDASIKNPAEVSEAIGLNEQGGVSVEKLISALLLKNTAEDSDSFQSQLEEIQAQLQAALLQNEELATQLEQFKLVLGQTEQLSETKKQNEDLIKMISELQHKAEKNRAAKVKNFQALEIANNEIKTLKLVVASMSDSNEANSRMLALQQQIESHQSVIKSQLDIISALKHENVQQLSSISSIQAEFEALRAKVRYAVRDDALQEEVLILTKENNKLRTHIGMLQSDVAYYEAKLAAYAKAVDSFKAEFISETETQMKTLQELLDLRVKKYEQALKEKGDVITQLQSDNTTLAGERDAARNSLADLTSHASKLEGTIAERDAFISALQSDTSAAEAVRSEMSKQLEALREQLTATQKEKFDLEEQLKSANNTTSTVSSDLENKTQEATKLSEELNASRKETEEAKQQVAASKDEVKSLHEELERKKSELASYGQSNSDVVAKLAKTEQTLSKTETTLKELEDSSSSEIKQLKEQLDAANQTVTTLRGDVSSLTSSVAEKDSIVSAKAMSVSDLENSLASTRSNLTSMVDSANKEIEMLRAAIKEKEAQIESDVETKSKLEASLSDTNIGLKSLESDVSSKQSTIEALEAELAKLKSDSVDAQLNLESKLESAKKHIDALESSLKTGDSSLVEKLALIGTLESSKADLESKVASLRSEVSSNESQIAALEAKVADDEELIKTMQATISEQSSKLTEGSDTISTLEKNLRESSSSLKKMKSDSEATKSGLEQKVEELSLKLSHSSSCLATSEIQSKENESSAAQLRQKVASLEKENEAALAIIAKAMHQIKQLKEASSGLKNDVNSSVSAWISSLGMIQLKWKLALTQAADKQRQVDVAFYSAKLADVNAKISHVTTEKSGLEQKLRDLTMLLNNVPTPKSSSMTVPVFTFAVVMVTFFLGRGLRTELFVTQ